MCTLCLPFALQDRVQRHQTRPGYRRRGAADRTTNTFNVVASPVGTLKQAADPSLRDLLVIVATPHAVRDEVLSQSITHANWRDSDLS